MRKHTATGFTLIEVIITLSIIAILAAIITPLVINNLDQAKLARAASDTHTIGTAMIKFKQDLGFWPVYATYTPATRTNSNPVELLLSMGDFPTHNAAGDNWNQASRLFFAYALTDNAPGYPNDSATRAQGLPVWNGPYISINNADPWDMAYLCNVEYLPGGVSPSNAVIIYILSAGPDKMTNTPFNTTGVQGGDDIVFRIR